MQEVLSTTSASVSTTTSLVFQSGAGSAYAYNDIEVVADGWTSTTTMAYNTGNELTSYSAAGAATVSFGYDAWGNLTAKSDGTSSATYSWHYGGKLTGVTSTFPHEGSVTYNYGGDGKRRERDDGTTVAQYNWDEGWNIINEEDNAGALTQTYVRAPIGEVGPVLADVSGSAPASGTYRYYGLDNLGSTRSLWNPSKSPIGFHAYTPYGDSYSASGESAHPMFTGYWWDNTCALYYAPYRYLSPDYAKWLSRDPLGLVDGPNEYAYARCSPPQRNGPAGPNLYMPQVEVHVQCMSPRLEKRHVVSQ
jgi:RHS repeat-associated protein